MIKIVFLGSIVLLPVFFLLWEYRKGQHHRGVTHHHGIRHKHGEGFSIDLYAYASDIRSWSADFKVTFSIFIILFCIGLNNFYVSVAIIIAMAYLTVVKGGLPMTEYLLVLTLPAAFILLGTFTIAIEFSTEPIGQYHFNLGVGYIITSQNSLKKMLFLIIKIFAAISALQMMSLSTPSNEIISVFRKAHVPKLVIELMYLIYRFIFIIVDVHTQMKNSAESRQGFRSFKTSCFTFGSIASNMLVVSLKKANTYYNAMESRCFDGELLFLEEDKRIDKNQLVVAAAFLLFLILLWGFTR